jgi:universal stress protein A
MLTYQNVLIATNLSAENNIIIEKGLWLARAFNATVSLFHVVEPLPGYGYAYVGVVDIEAELLLEARKNMEILSKKYNIAAQNCYIEVGLVKIAIIDFVTKKNIDCLVLGSHGRHGFSELLGSTVHTAVHLAPCDVMTLRIKSEQ